MSKPDNGEDAPFTERDGWVFEDGVRCAVCPGCAFTFDAGHIDNDGAGYSCPVCDLDEASHSGRQR